MKLPLLSRHGELEDFIDSEFFVCLYFKLDARKGRQGEIDHFVHLAEPLSTSSYSSDLDAIAESWGQGPSLDNHALITAWTRSALILRGMMQ